MHYIQIIPIFVTLAATIIGIFWIDAFLGKILLVALAVLASMATLWGVHDQSEQMAATQGKLTALVGIANPNEKFLDKVLDGFREIALEHGLPEGNTNRLSDGNTIVHFRRKESSSICGVLRISPLMVETVFEEYAQQMSATSYVHANESFKHLKLYIRKLYDSAVIDTKGEDELLRDIAYISQFPLKREESGSIIAKPTVASDSNRDKIVIVELNRKNGPTKVVFDADDMKNIASSRLLERGRLIFSKVWPEQAGDCEE